MQCCWGLHLLVETKLNLIWHPAYRLLRWHSTYDNTSMQAVIMNHEQDMVCYNGWSQLKWMCHEVLAHGPTQTIHSQGFHAQGRFFFSRLKNEMEKSSPQKNKILQKYQKTNRRYKECPKKTHMSPFHKPYHAVAADVSSDPTWGSFHTKRNFDEHYNTWQPVPLTMMIAAGIL